MVARDIDIVIEAIGSNSFRPIRDAELDTTFYERAKKIRQLKRTLLGIRCGAEADLASNLKDLLAEIDGATGNQLGRIGALCVYGTSNGSGLVLALAKALQDRGAPKPTYLGLADLPMMPFGRNPPVPGIGNLQPVNRPEVSFGIGAQLVPLGGKLIPPSVAHAPPPRINDPGVDAGKRENFFTRQGNRVRLFSQSPAGRLSWWWTSTMNFGEVHGEVGGWTNLERTTSAGGPVLGGRGPGSIDENHHDQLCGLALKEMQHHAGLALGEFVTKLAAL